MKRLIAIVATVTSVLVSAAPLVRAESPKAGPPQASAVRVDALPIDRDVRLEISRALYEEVGKVAPQADEDLLAVHLPVATVLAYAERQAAQGGRIATMKAGIAYQMIEKNDRAYAAYRKVLAYGNDTNDEGIYNRMAVVAPEGTAVFAVGKPVSFGDVLPVIMNGRTMVPVRAVTEALGAQVEFDNDTQTATFSIEGKAEVKITSGSTTAQIGGRYVTLDVEPTIVPPGRFVVPLRFISEAFGYDVRWHSQKPGHGIVSIRDLNQ